MSDSAKRAFANWARLALGVILAILVFLILYPSDTHSVITYLLPGAIVLIVLLDFVGYMKSESEKSVRG